MTTMLGPAGGIYRQGVMEAANAFVASLADDEKQWSREALRTFIAAAHGAPLHARMQMQDPAMQPKYDAVRDRAEEAGAAHLKRFNDGEEDGA